MCSSRVPDAEIAMGSTIAILIDDSLKISKKTRTGLIQSSMIQRGFNVTSIEDAQYILFHTEEESKLTRFGAVPMMMPVYGAIDDGRKWEMSYRTQHIPNIYMYIEKKLYFLVIRKDAFFNQKLQKVWGGSIHCSIDDWNESPKSVMDTMFHYFPDNRKGLTPIITALR